MYWNFHLIKLMKNSKSSFEEKLLKGMSGIRAFCVKTKFVCSFEQ